MGSSTGYWAFAGGGGTPVYQPENVRLIQETGSPSTVGLWMEYVFDGYMNVWQDYQEGLLAWKFDNPVPLESGRYAKAWLYAASPPLPTSVLEYVSAGTNGTYMQIMGQLNFKILTEDFTLSTIDKAGIQALSGVGSTTWRLFTRGETPSSQDMDSLKAEEDVTFFDGMDGSAGTKVYGFSLYVVDFNIEAEGYNLNDEFHFDSQRPNTTGVTMIVTTEDV